MSASLRPSFRKGIAMCFAALCGTVVANKASALGRGSSSEKCPAVSPSISTASVMQMLSIKESILDVQASPQANYTFLKISSASCQALMDNELVDDPYVYSWRPREQLCRKQFTGVSPSEQEIRPAAASAIRPGECFHNEDCQSCSTCTAGSWCSQGIYADTPGNCQPGFNGHYVDVNTRNCHERESRTQRSVCRPRECGPGTVSAGVYSVECTPCPAGQWYAGRNGEECICAPRGSYQDQQGQAAAIECAAGTISTEECSAECTQCPAGEFQPSTGSHECLCVPIGNRATTDSTNYEICPFGSFASSACQPECNICERAWYYLFIDLILPHDCNAQYAVRFDTNSTYNGTFVLPAPAAAGSSAGSSSSLGLPENHSTIFDASLINNGESSSLPSQDAVGDGIWRTFGGLFSSLGSSLGSIVAGR